MSEARIQLAMQPPDGALFFLSGEFRVLTLPPAWPTRFDGSLPTLTIRRLS